MKYMIVGMEPRGEFKMRFRKRSPRRSNSGRAMEVPTIGAHGSPASRATRRSIACADSLDLQDAATSFAG